MNTSAVARKTIVARVAIDVRLYFDVPTSSDNPEEIRQVAREELERVAYGEQIRIKRLRFPEIYPTDVWPVMKLADFQVCQVCPSNDANRETRFPL